MTPTEKRIYALAQKWAKASFTYSAAWSIMGDRSVRAKQRQACGRALLKLFKERKREDSGLQE